MRLYLGWNMNYAGGSGLAETNWKEWIRFLMSRKLVKLNQDIPFRILKDIDWEQIYMVDRNKYPYKSIDATLTMQGVDVSSVEMYSI